MQSHQQTQTTPDIIDYEAKGREFLDYVAQHHHEIKRALAKNVSYDRDLLDDILGETVVRIHSSIVNNHVDVANYKMYIFQSMKWAYYGQQNKQRKQSKAELRNYYDNPRNNDGCLDYDVDFSDEEDREDLVTRETRQVSSLRILDLVKSQLAGIFGMEWVDVFLRYYQAKVDGRSLSYEKIAVLLELPYKEVRSNLSQMKAFVRESYDFAV